MSKTLNICKLATEIEKLKMTKIQVAESCGISRVTLDNALKGKEIGLHKFLKIIDILGINIGYFFDEENVEVREAGRDYVEKGKIEYKGTEYNGPVTMADSELEKENQELKRKLIAAQERIIELMDSKSNG